MQAVGYATTVDIERGTHPPDKQDVAVRVGLELARVAFGSDNVVSRGPELLHSVPSNRSSSTIIDGIGNNLVLSDRHTVVSAVVLTFSNSTLVSHGGILVANGSATPCGFGQDTLYGARFVAEMTASLGALVCGVGWSGLQQYRISITVVHM